MKKIILISFLFINSASVFAQPKTTDDEIKKQIIAQSLSSYSGKCPCPYSVMSSGQSCGTKSAYSKPGGTSVICFLSDVNSTMIKNFKSNNLNSLVNPTGNNKTQLDNTQRSNPSTQKLIVSPTESKAPVNNIYITNVVPKENAPSTPQKSIEQIQNDLQKIDLLRQSVVTGVITEEQFEVRKNQILNGIK